MSLDFLAGCAGGAAGVIVGHPLDTVKVRLQTQSPGNIKYRGTFQTLSMIVKQESALGLYKGITSPLVGVAGVNAIVFGVYGLLRPYVAGSPGHDALWAHFLAGSISGSVQSIICSPMELVKIRMQVDETAVKKSSLDVIKNIYKSEGGLFRGIYKGWVITLLREIPGFGSYFATYELLTTKTGYQVGTLGMLFAGGMAGVVSWIFCFPMDVVKTRIQMDTKKQYSGIADCVAKTFKAEGYKPFFRGLNSSVIRAFPTNAATFTVVNWIMRLADSKQNDLQSGRAELARLIEEWDYAKKIASRDFYNFTRRVPSYNYLAAPQQTTAFQKSPTIQYIDLNLKKMASFLEADDDEHDNNHSNISLEEQLSKFNNFSQKDYTNSNDDDASSENHEETYNCPLTFSSGPFCENSEVCSNNNNNNNNIENNNLAEKETLVVPKNNTDNQCEKTSTSTTTSIYLRNNENSCNNNINSHKDNYNSSFYNVLTRWLSNFTLTPVHFCKCIDNCNCRF